MNGPKLQPTHDRHSASSGAGVATTRQTSSAPVDPSIVHAVRETVESIAIAVMLAFLFRTFIGEAFVIPTGSMAPTLAGNHKDVFCTKCGCPYQANASVENEDNWNYDREVRVAATTCPLCRYTMVLDPTENADHVSFTGDRILVSKFSYDLQEPRRWDVIVFKYPNNAKQNYIKRLVGLPGETITIRHGDVYVRPTGDAAGAESDRIVRKPPDKLLAMLQVVDDTQYLAPDLMKAGWPSRWQPADTGESPRWRLSEADRPAIALPESANANEAESWLRYRHLLPSYEDWQDLDANRPLDLPRANRESGQLIGDFYAYNAYTTSSAARSRGLPTDYGPDLKALGTHWVGDLAFEAQVKVADSKGQLLLDLVESGVHYRCTIDVASGKAVLAIQGEGTFCDASLQPSASSPTGQTGLRGAGTYSLRFSNVDDELRLWVDDRLIEFDGPTTYLPPAESRPAWSETDLGDLAPVGIGVRDVKVELNRLRVLRDVYYIATRGHLNTDHEYDHLLDDRDILQVFGSPRTWATTLLFPSRRSVTVEMQADQFFPMGDNSPQSKDARLWGSPEYVERELLTGKAVFVYWPHSWNSPIPFTPNFSRIRLIR